MANLYATIDDLDGDWPIVLTTETRSRVLHGIVVFSSVGILLIIILGGIIWSHERSVTYDSLPIYIIAPFLLSIIALLMGFAPTRGTWVIDPKQIEFRPCHGRPRLLAWTDVNRVMWWAPCGAIQGPGVSIPLPWTLIDEGERERMRARLTKLLPEFDLSRRPAPREVARDPSLPGQLVLWGKIVAVAIAGAIPLIACILAIGLGLPGIDDDVFRGVTLLVSLVLLHGVFVVFMLRQVRAELRANPPWRYRLAKSGGPFEP